MSYKVILSSEEGGHETFTYAKRSDALEALDRLTVEAEENYTRDGIRRGVVMAHAMDRTVRTKRKEKKHE